MKNLQNDVYKNAILAFLHKPTPTTGIIPTNNGNKNFQITINDTIVITSKNNTQSDLANPLLKPAIRYPTVNNTTIASKT